MVAVGVGVEAGGGGGDWADAGVAGGVVEGRSQGGCWGGWGACGNGLGDCRGRLSAWRGDTAGDRHNARDGWRGCGGS